MVAVKLVRLFTTPEIELSNFLVVVRGPAPVIDPFSELMVEEESRDLLVAVELVWLFATSEVESSDPPLVVDIGPAPVSDRVSELTVVD